MKDVGYNIDKLTMFEDAVEHVTELGRNTTRSVSSSDGWAMINARRLTDLEIIEEKYNAIVKLINGNK